MTCCHNNIDTARKIVTLSEKTEMLKDKCVFSKEINNLKL